MTRRQHLKYFSGPEITLWLLRSVFWQKKQPAEGKEPSPYTGFIDDTVIRKLGYSLVDGSILGLALVVGTPHVRSCSCDMP